MWIYFSALNLSLHSILTFWDDLLAHALCLDFNPSWFTWTQVYLGLLLAALNSRLWPYMLLWFALLTCASLENPVFWWDCGCTTSITLCPQPLTGKELFLACWLTLSGSEIFLHSVVSPLNTHRKKDVFTQKDRCRTLPSVLLRSAFSRRVWSCWV